MTWVQPAGRLKQGTVWNVTVDPSSPATLYAGTHDGLFKSVDGGVNWSVSHRGMKSINVLALAMHPIDRRSSMPRRRSASTSRPTRGGAGPLRTAMST